MGTTWVLLAAAFFGAAYSIGAILVYRAKEKARATQEEFLRDFFSQAVADILKGSPPQSVHTWSARND